MSTTLQRALAWQAKRRSPLGPCRHLGPATGEQVACGACKKGARLKLFSCAKHGLCTPQTSIPDTACCATCPDNAPVGAPDVVPGVADPLPAPELRPVPPGWAHRPDVITRHQAALRKLL